MSRAKGLKKRPSASGADLLGSATHEKIRQGWPKQLQLSKTLEIGTCRVVVGPVLGSKATAGKCVEST